MKFGAFTILANPLLPPAALAILATLFLLILGLALWRGARGAFFRFGAAAAIILSLLDPALIEERRDYKNDIVIVLVDRSPSQKLENRWAVTNRALAALKQELGQFGDVEIKIVESGRSGDVAEKGTELFASLQAGLTDLDPARIAGLFVISDGQIHDVPASLAELGFDAPVHLLLSGDPKRFDRRIDLIETPSFGLVGKSVDLKFKIDDLGLEAGAPADIRIKRDGKDLPPISAQSGAEISVPLDIAHGGQSVFEIEVAPGPDELTDINNRAVITVNGVRDRLRVLLISGEPYPGERTWRNLLKSDPSVDLIHFTILRPPNKQDATPINELALIAFPIDELFNVKLKEFDLVIFDRFEHLGILPEEYFRHIVDYVQDGGAVLEAAGPGSAGRFSLYRTPLAAIFAALPTGGTTQSGFTPGLSEIGKRHPVTADLAGADQTDPSWGRWFRQIDAIPHGGEVLMTGIGGQPLLVLDHVGKGRVAQLLSDHLWLWAKGFEGGGPQAELVRRTAHWLMREPELEEEDLRATAIDGRLEIVRRSLAAQDNVAVTVTRPDGSQAKITLGAADKGRAATSLPITDQGLYRVSDGSREAFAALGEVNSLEFKDPRASLLPLKALRTASGGGIVLAADQGVPALRRVAKTGDRAGTGWLGLVRNEDYVITGIDETPLLPAWAGLFLALGLILAAWRREGR